MDVCSHGSEISVHEQTCRICYEPGGVENLCNCSGSMRYVHEECLVKWLQVSGRRTCELCNVELKIVQWEESAPPGLSCAVDVTHVILCLVILILVIYMFAS